MRHYYNVFCLLESDTVKDFIGSVEYFTHKNERFRKPDIQNIRLNPAFQMKERDIYENYEKQYEKSKTLYYRQKVSL